MNHRESDRIPGKLVLEVSRKKESGIGMTSRFLLVLEISEELTPAFVRPVEIYQPLGNVVRFLNTDRGWQATPRNYCISVPDLGVHLNCGGKPAAQP